jgi:hypothetical protein
LTKTSAIFLPYTKAQKKWQFSAKSGVDAKIGLVD